MSGVYQGQVEGDASLRLGAALCMCFSHCPCVWSPAPSLPCPLSLQLSLYPTRLSQPSIFSPHLPVSSPPFSGLQFHVECQLYTRPSVFWRPGREAVWWGVGYPRPGQGWVEVGWGPQKMALGEGLPV